MRTLLIHCWLMCFWSVCLPRQHAALAAERAFDFSSMQPGKIPAGFKPALAGEGAPGEWKIIMDTVPPVLAPLSSNAPVLTQRPVLAQVSQDKTDERFPMLIFEPESFANFKFSARVKTVAGQAEQMAGLVFRYQNASNYTVLRVSSLGNTLRFYKVANGERLGIITSPISAPTNQWHELAVECEGNQIRCTFNGKEYPPITDNSQALGKIGFWTKSDSVSYFAEARVVYQPLSMPAETLVREFMRRYPKLLGLRVAVAGREPGSTRIVGSNVAGEIGTSGSVAEGKVLTEGATYYGKDRKSVTVTMPLRDRNGEVIAAARVVMSTFKGQTEKNAVERAAPIVREMQAGVQSMEDLAY